MSLRSSPGRLCCRDRCHKCGAAALATSTLPAWVCATPARRTSVSLFDKIDASWTMLQCGRGQGNYRPQPNMKTVQPRGCTACLQQPAHGTGNVDAIWTEACRCDRLLECEMVQQCPTLAIDQQGAAVLVYREQKLAVRADANSSHLQVRTASPLHKLGAKSKACSATATAATGHTYVLGVLERQR